MSVAKIWKGFGGVRFLANGITADFPGAEGNTKDSPIKIIKENDSYNLIPRIVGSRLSITTKKLYNLDATDYLQYQYLAEIINYLFFQEGDIASGLIRTVIVYPRYDSTLTNNLNYRCTLKSDITASDIARIKCGNVMDLEWLVLDKQTGIETFFSDTEGSVYWNGTDEYWDGTDNYYDGLG